MLKMDAAPLSFNTRIVPSCRARKDLYGSIKRDAIGQLEFHALHAVRKEFHINKQDGWAKVVLDATAAYVAGIFGGVMVEQDGDMGLEVVEIKVSNVNWFTC